MQEQKNPAETNIRKLRSRRQRGSQLTSVQVMFAAILAIGLMLAINFSNRIEADRSLEEVHDKVLLEIDLLKREQAELIDELNYVKSDAYVEAWARSEGKMVRDGEVLVIPKPASVFASDQPDSTPATELLVEVDTTPPQPEPWTLWWALFFDSSLPEF